MGSDTATHLHITSNVWKLLVKSRYTHFEDKSTYMSTHLLSDSNVCVGQTRQWVRYMLQLIRSFPRNLGTIICLECNSYSC